MDSTGSQKVWCSLVGSWDASFTPGMCTWRTCLPHKFNWRHLPKLQNQPCVLFPVSCTQTDAEAHFFPNLKCSSTADQTWFTNPVLLEKLRLDTTVLGLWVSGSTTLSCGSKHQNLGEKLYLKSFQSQKTWWSYSSVQNSHSAASSPSSLKDLLLPQLTTTCILEQLWNCFTSPEIYWPNSSVRTIPWTSKIILKWWCYAMHNNPLLQSARAYRCFLESEWRRKDRFKE